MDFVEQVHLFGFSNIHTFESNISLIRLFSLIFNYSKLRTFVLTSKAINLLSDSAEA